MLLHTLVVAEKFFRESFSNNFAGFDATCKRSEKTFSVPRYIGQHNAMEIFAVKWNVVSDISKVLLNDIFAALNGSSGIKNIITDSDK